MEKLAVRLRHGTAEPIHTEVNGNLLTRIRGVHATQAIEMILQALPEEKRPYAQAFLSTMHSSDAVVEVVTVSETPTEADEEVVAVDRRREEPFDEVLSKLARQHGGNVDALEAIEIGTARLEKGGARAVASLPAQEGDSHKAVPLSGTSSLPRHPFFAAAQQMPFIVSHGQVWRVRHDPHANKPYLLFCEERFALEEDQSLQAYDVAYFEDDNALFEKTLRQHAIGEAGEQLSRAPQRPASLASNLPDFIVNHLIPRLRNYQVGRERAARREALSSYEQVSPFLPSPKPVWRPQPLPLLEVLPPHAFILAPHVYRLTSQGGLWRRAYPDPGVYFPRATYGFESVFPLSEVEAQYAQTLADSLERESKRRAPRYLHALLQQQNRAQQVEAHRQLCERSHRDGSEFVLYHDHYHGVAVKGGVFFLYRRVPAFVLRSAITQALYRCDATRLLIALRSTNADGVFFRGCVRADSGFQHPLVGQSQVVIMDRCDDDITALKNTHDLCGALVKHLNDAKMMLEIGFPHALPPEGRAQPLSPEEAKQLALPVYHYRHGTARKGETT